MNTFPEPYLYGHQCTDHEAFKVIVEYLWKTCKVGHGHSGVGCMNPSDNADQPCYSSQKRGRRVVKL